LNGNFVQIKDARNSEGQHPFREIGIAKFLAGN
jgi:hypothetical protein